MITQNLNIIERLCTGCGACIEACPISDDFGKKPIYLKLLENRLRVANIDSTNCSKCRNCYKTCPNSGENIHNIRTFESYCASVGVCYSGYSNDRQHRFDAATGGVATEIASYLLDAKKVDGVLSSYQDCLGNICTEIFTSGDDVKKTCGSIYGQVNLLEGLVAKISEGNFNRIFVVGLPCHIAGLRRLYASQRYLRDNVEFITLALFCKQTKTNEFSRFVRRILRVKKESVITFRGEGWPGYTCCEGKKIKFNNIKLSILWKNFIFTPDYCFACNDPLGLCADISVGDAWLRRYSSDKLGTGFLIANTEEGRKVLEAIASERRLTLDRVESFQVVQSQDSALMNVKINGYKLLKENHKEFLLSSISRKIYLYNKVFRPLYSSRFMLFFPGIILRILRKIMRKYSF